MARKEKRGEEPRYVSGRSNGGETLEPWNTGGRSRHKWFRKRKKGEGSRRSRFDDEEDDEDDIEDDEGWPAVLEGHYNLSAAGHAIGDEIMEEATRAEAWGIASAIDIYDCNPDLIRDAEAIRSFVVELCELIEMKRFGETQVVHFGEDERVAGFSMVQLIETSLISGHFANLTNAVYLDVFSCKPYNPQVVREFSQAFFEGSRSSLQVALRR